MKTLSALLLALGCFVPVVLAQVPAPSSFLFPTNVHFNITTQQAYDMHANELGINVVWDSSGTLRYALIGLNGRVLNQSILATSYSTGWLRPAITSIKRGTREDIVVFYRHQDSVRAAISTDAGTSWLLVPSEWATDNAASNRMDAVTSGSSIHVTWDTGTNPAASEVHYAMLNFSFNPPVWQNEYTSTLGDIEGIDKIGSDPQIVISNGNKVHIVYLTQKFEDDSPPRGYYRIVERARALSTQLWDSVDVVVRLDSARETCNSAKGHAHCIATYTLPCPTIMDGVLYVTTGYNNTQNITDPCACLSAQAFHYAECWEDSLNTPPDHYGATYAILHLEGGGSGAYYPSLIGNAFIAAEDSLIWA